MYMYTVFQKSHPYDFHDSNENQLVNI